MIWAHPLQFQILQTKNLKNHHQFIYLDNVKQTIWAHLLEFQILKTKNLKSYHKFIRLARGFQGRESNIRIKITAILLVEARGLLNVKRQCAENKIRGAKVEAFFYLFMTSL